MSVDAYDAVVIGAGAGGGTAAAELTAAGRRVLLLERGRAVAPAEVSRDHLRNHVSDRFPNALSPEPGEHPRVFEAPGGDTSVVEPPHWRHNHTANAVGGGTLVWGMQAWRMHPWDFAMASRYGVPAGSSLADWPITYADLEPFYVRAEWELGVAGPDDSGYAPRSRGYPMAPLPATDIDRTLAAGAGILGLRTQRVPLALNSLPRDGRAGCIRCRECIGFSCPVDAKNGTHNSMIPRAVSTGFCVLADEAQATRITVDGSGTVDGVEYTSRVGGTMTTRRARAGLVVLAAGAIETARLLLLSSSHHHPHGLGNHSDHVGRHLQGHTYPVVYGAFPEGTTFEQLGPGPSSATVDFAHDNPGVIGGAMLANDFARTPIGFWQGSLPPDLPRWGIANKRAMRSLFRRVADVRGPVQEIPSPGSRVRLDPAVRDSAGVPVARLAGDLHPETIRTADLIGERAAAWLRASGAERVWRGPLRTGISVAHHQAGTARMSADPGDGVTDPSGRVHGHDNLFVADAAVHVTNGAFNPALTIVALALRTGAHAAAQR